MERRLQASSGRLHRFIFVIRHTAHSPSPAHASSQSGVLFKLQDFLASLSALSLRETCTSAANFQSPHHHSIHLQALSGV